MELNINLLENPKYAFLRIILGILLIVCSCGYIIIRITAEEAVRAFDWFYFGIFAINGIIQTIDGLGFFYGKAYVLINPELISLKASVFDKRQSIYWNNIKFIDAKSNKLIIAKKDNTNMVVNLSKFSYSLRSKIKGTIDCIAKEKNIQSTI